MCAGQAQNWLNPDPSKHAFSLSGMGMRYFSKNKDLKRKLAAERSKGLQLPEGTQLVAKGYGPKGE